jgi:hypothetical protein
MTSLTDIRRLFGILVSWHLSKNGGHGHAYVPATNETFFIHRQLIISGQPEVGRPLSFIPAPAKPGTNFRRASQAIIDNKSKRVTALDLLAGKVDA